MAQVTEQMVERAMDFLAEYEGTSAVLVAMQRTLEEGGFLTNDDVVVVGGLARWWNMDKGN